MKNTAMAHQFARYLMLGSLLLLVVSCWQKDILPKPSLLRQELLTEPEQTPISPRPKQTNVGGVTYTINPLYRYELNGLVVSLHDAGTWQDSLHERWNDHLNVVDLCVVWGNNIRRYAYKEVTFSSGQFTCYISTRSPEAYSTFDPTALSNNHLITDDNYLARKLRDVKIGDQIHLRGYLAEYSHNQGFPFKRGTSVVRTDSGNGACETVYVEDFEVLGRGGHPWRSLFWIAVILLIIGIALWAWLPLRIEY